MLVQAHNVEKETEKAIKLNITVSWADNLHLRSFWFPKSLVKHVKDDLYEIQTWFAWKLEKENTFHGYQMVISNLD